MKLTGKESSALAALVSLIDSGYEFPDAVYVIAEQHSLTLNQASRVERAYDIQCGASAPWNTAHS